MSDLNKAIELLQNLGSGDLLGSYRSHLENDDSTIENIQDSVDEFHMSLGLQSTDVTVGEIISGGILTQLHFSWEQKLTEVPSMADAEVAIEHFNDVFKMVRNIQKTVRLKFNI